MSQTVFEVRFETLTEAWLEPLLLVEQRTYAHPWNRANFEDAMRSGNQIQLLLAGETLVGYFVAMKGVDEVHLLKIWDALWAAGIPCHAVTECLDDDAYPGQTMAIGVRPTRDRDAVRKVLSSLPLAR